MRWLMVDRFTELVRGEYACAIRNVTLGEDHLHDHFPGFPTMPRSLIIEGLAQTGGVLVGLSTGFRELVVLAKVERMVFHDMVLPGDQMSLRADLEEIRDEGARVSGVVTVADRRIAEGSIMFARVPRDKASIVADDENYVFSRAFMSALGIDRASREAVASGHENADE